LKVIERFFPASFAQIKQKQAKVENQNGQSEGFSKLMSGETSAQELLSQADKYTKHQRIQILRRAAEKTAQSGNIPEAQKIIEANMSEEESDSYQSQFNSQLASQAVGQGKFDEAIQYINQIKDENNRLNGLINLATLIHEKNPQKNQKLATSVLDQVRASLPNMPETTTEMNYVAQISAAFAQIDTPEAFRQIESLTAPLNEYFEASAVVAKFNDYGNFRQGEYQISSNSIPFAYNLTNVLQKLKSKDFDRTLQFINRFYRLDTRIGLQIQLLDLDFSQATIQNLPIDGRRFSSLEILARFTSKRKKA
jgi:predicted negative regulator of RcsB-dependent stress response